jgi:hypothetical protein
MSAKFVAPCCASDTTVVLPDIAPASAAIKFAESSILKVSLKAAGVTVEQNPENTSTKSIVSKGDFGDRASPEWRVIAAGAPISANAYHCALVGADWALADADRINARRKRDTRPELRRVVRRIQQ